MLRTHDNWERLVGAVIKKQQLWELCHAHSRSPSVLSEATSSDLSSSSFREINILSTYRVQKFVLVSDFSPSFNVEDANLNSLELLGTGTFGNTYAGDVSDGVKIVLKRFNKSISVSEEEFKRSVDFVGSIRHENVVALRAYYCTENEKLMMYDYYSKGSVYHLLHGQTRPQVGWETRLRIAIGVARGLATIHAQLGGKLVHGNIKSTNIFINQGNYGCVSDLGMINVIASKFRRNEHFHAPDVKKRQNISQESDVYSFGILLFELLTGKPSAEVLGGSKAVDLVKLMKSVKSTASDVFDEYLLRHTIIRGQMIRVLQIGISCVLKSSKERPKMSEVAKMLEDLHISNAPKGPNFVLVNQNFKSDVAKMLEYRLRRRADWWRLDREVLGPWDLLKNGTLGISYTVCHKNGIAVWVKGIDVSVTPWELERHLDIIGRINHENCAKLEAYYFSRDEALLVYDHYNDNNLLVLLYGNVRYISHNRKHLKPLAWDARLTIALTLAKGIAHIHKLDSTLVHGNIRPSNILVTRFNKAIITNPALWKLREPIVLRRRSYFPPEVKDTREVSQASDVYSFGVVLLELLTRRYPQEMGSDDKEVISLVSLVRNHVVPDWTSTMIDPDLMGYDATKEVLLLAMDCVDNASEKRPTMCAVVERLEEISGICKEESEPSMVSQFMLVRSLEDQLSKLTT